MLIQMLLIFIVTESVIGENQFMSAVHNLTDNSNLNQTNRNSRDENVLRTGILKYLNECKTDLTKYRTTEYNWNLRDDGGNVGTDPGYYNPLGSDNKGYKRSDRENRNFDDSNIDGYLTSYQSKSHDRNSYQKDSCSNKERDYNYGRNIAYRNNNNNNDRTARRNYEDLSVNYDQREESRIIPYESSNYNRRGRIHYNGESSHANDPNREYSGYASQGNVNYPSNDDFIRWKRENNHCVTQCIFGYMELLDENSMPSESATIKFLQDHTSNDRTRLKLVRDTRRCFAKLATAEHENGCEFSKILAKCMKLNVE